MSKIVSSSVLILLISFAALNGRAQTTWFSALNASTTNTTAVISWTTAVPASTQVRYGLTTNYGSHTVLDSTMVTAHSATLTGLTPGTLYHFRMLAKDAEPLLLTSNDYTLTTPAAAVSVAITPATGTITSGSSEQLTAQVANATNTAVTWTTTSGSVTASGLFTAPVVAANQQVIVTATSVADPTKSASAVWTVTAPIQHSVTLNWQASPTQDVVAYNTYRSLAHGGPYSLLASALSNLAYTDLSVQSGTTYYYVVTAVDAQGLESTDSSEVSAVIPTP